MKLVRVVSSWQQLGQDIDGEAADDTSGWPVSLSAYGNIVAIGAYHNDNGNGFSSGMLGYSNWMKPVQVGNSLARTLMEKQPTISQEYLYLYLTMAKL